jgi:beta-N-acetylhexosaminidase
MTVPELAGGVIVASYGGTRAPIRLVRSLDLAGVIVGSANVSTTTAQQATNRRLQRAVDRPGGWPLVVAVDQEGGQVSRLGPPVTQLPSYMSLGAAARPVLAREAATVTGAELRRAGFTMVMAPVADVTIGADDTAIGSRSAGSDPGQVSKLVVSSLRGFTRAGIVPVVKHFPGHGSVTVDSHLGLPRQRHSVGWLSRRDFIPFQRAVDAHAPAVMVGHIALSHVDRGVPADLSADSIDLLRHELGFDGLVVSDSLQMSAVTKGYRGGQAAVAALRAGVDVVLMPVDPAAARDAIIRAVDNGTLSRERLEVSVARIGAAMLHEKRSEDLPARVVDRAGRALSERITAAAVTVVSGDCRGPYIAGAVRPIGPRWLVRSFSAVARASGLRVGAGPRLLLVDSDDRRLRRATIAVAVDVPYRLAALPQVPTRFALYSSSPSALQALVDVLQGKRRAAGQLPVEVNAARSRCA